MTKFNWREVFQMSAMEFFVFLNFVNYTRRKEEEEIKKLQRRRK